MSSLRGMAMMAGLIAAGGICTLGAAAQGSAQTKPDGAALFKEHCSMCHVSGGAKGSQAPAFEVLAQKTPGALLRAPASGPMVIYGNRMSEAERRAIAAYLSSNTSNSAALTQANLCPKSEPISAAGLKDPRNWNGWGVDVVNSRYQAHTSIGADNVAGLKLKWA